MHEWRKSEKNYYLPKAEPEHISIPVFKYFAVEGQGNPNDDFFAEYIGVLYSLSYAVKMSPKSGTAPKDYYEYRVYPLEGIWDISEDAKQNPKKQIDKNQLKFNLMIRQPDFLTEDFVHQIIETTKKKKPHDLLEKVNFSVIEDGECVQMMHLGSYDDESESFSQMKDYCQENKLIRISHQHREVYLSDARKVSQDKLKTVLRFKVKPL